MYIRPIALFIIQYAVLTLFGIVSNVLPVYASGVDYSRCAIDANQTYWDSPNDTFLYDRYGKPTSNVSQAWGISYESCTVLCGAPVNTQSYDWNSISQGFTSWLLPWLALTAQLPFETKDKQTNFMALLLALGNPSLITFSLALTILNARWINRVFRQIKEHNKVLQRPLQVKAIKAARAFLIESQHIPLQVFNGARREIAHLVVFPENWAWWLSLREEIRKTKRVWTYSLYAQVGWVCVAQLMAIVNFFTSTSYQSGIGIGLAINFLWIWMIPVILGWVYVGTQTSAGSIKAAIASCEVPVLGPERNLSGECIGIRDRTVFDDSFTQPRDSLDEHHNYSEEHSSGSAVPSRHSNIPASIVSASHQPHQDAQITPKASASHSNVSESSQTVHQSEDVELADFLGGVGLPAKPLTDPEQQSEPLQEHEHRYRASPRTFLGFSIAGCDLEPGPIFNYARIWSHMNAARHIAEAFWAVTDRQRKRQPVHGKSWDQEPNRWDENLRGTPEELSKYISVHKKDEPNFSIHERSSRDLVLNCVTATFVTLFLQWGSVGAAIIIAYK